MEILQNKEILAKEEGKRQAEIEKKNVEIKWVWYCFDIS